MSSQNTSVEVLIAELRVQHEHLQSEVKRNEVVLTDLAASLHDMSLNLVKIKYVCFGAAIIYLFQAVGITELLKTVLFK